MVHTSCELMWVKHLLEELRFEVQLPMDMYCDNQAVVHIASNHVFHERTKHIEVDCLLVRECVEKGLLLLRLCPLKHNLLICSPNCCADRNWSCCVKSWVC